VRGKFFALATSAAFVRKSTKERIEKLMERNLIGVVIKRE
jgi:hypothetical protein